MIVVAAAIVVAWSLLGGAHLSRHILGAERRTAGLVVVACYLCLGTAPLIVLGPGWQEWLAPLV